MHELVFYIAVVWLTALLVAAVIAVIVLRHKASRILALDMLTGLLVALLIVFATSNESPFYLDAALALALLSFISTVTISRYRAEHRVF